MKVLQVLCLVGVCGAALAVRSHGPAHLETNQHARHSQKLAEKMWHMQNTHRDELFDEFHKVVTRSRQDQLKDAMSGDRHELRRMRSRLQNLHNPSAAISLLEKTSFSKSIGPEPDEKEVMRDLFGFDEKRLQEEVSKLEKVDGDLLKSDSTSKDEQGFSEQAIKEMLAAEDAKTKQSQTMDQLLEFDEGAMRAAAGMEEIDTTAPSSKRVIDWKKWDRFMLDEFEAARLTGDLDAAAHALPKRQSRAPTPNVVENLEIGEGMSSKPASVESPSVDKLCGCEVTLANPVCGSDGETYPSECFAKCAGLAVSHSGPCLDKSNVLAKDSFKTVTENVDISKLLSIDAQATELLKPDTPAPIFQEAGVDFPSLSRMDATEAAREQMSKATARHDVKLPFEHVHTRRQFEEDMKELSHIADEFAPALNDERMAKCECRGSYSPVCGRDTKTYPSACYASCLGVELLHIGVCRDRPNLAQAPRTMEEVRDPLCFCSFKQKQVCGVNGKTYTNRCFADCEGMRVRYDGPCVAVRT